MKRIPAIQTDHVRRELVDFLQRAFTERGFANGIIGLSGGVDSAVVASLAAEALGPEHLTGVLMPYETSSPASLTDAHLLSEQLGIPTILSPVTDTANAYIQNHPGMDGVRKGNVMARLRMLTLYDQSAEKNALVLGTSNRSEILLGYGTICGDLASAINPLGQLFKTWVYDLARELQVPESIQTKAPSADLEPGQTDQSDLGFSYGDFDRVLYHLDVLHRPAGELLQAGENSALVDRAQELMARFRYKSAGTLIAPYDPDWLRSESN